MKKENHGSIPHKTIYNALETLYADWPLRGDLLRYGVDGILEHYKSLSEQFGYEIPAPEQALNLLGYQLMAQKKFKEAIQAFLLNVERYPDSANVYDSLGEGYEANYQYAQARRSYEMAVKKAKKNSKRYLEVYKDHLKRVNQKIGAE
jgi:tetratricopeptide (TPR) repeat protein